MKHDTFVVNSVSCVFAGFLSRIGGRSRGWGEKTRVFSGDKIHEFFFVVSDARMDFPCNENSRRTDPV